MEIKFSQNPGFYFDLYRVCIMKANHRGKWIHRVVNTGHESEDMKYVDEYLSQFDAIPVELCVFFYLRGRADICFFSELYMRLLKEKESEIDLEIFLRYLNDTEMVKRDICQFYFGEKVEDYNNPASISEALKQCDMITNSDVKFQLLKFLISPAMYIDLLKNKLVEYQQVLNQIYIKNSQVLKNVEKSFEASRFFEMINHVTSIEVVQGNELDISFCIVSKNIAIGYKTPGGYILGVDYLVSISNEMNLPISMAKWADAIGDKNRIRILRYILHYGVDTAFNMVKVLGISLSTLLYHLDRLETGQVLGSHRRNRTTFYWLNVQQCIKIIDHLKEWVEIGRCANEKMAETDAAEDFEPGADADD